MRCSLAIPFVLGLALPWACNQPRRSIQPSALRHVVTQEVPVFRVPAWFESAIVLPPASPNLVGPAASLMASPVAASSAVTVTTAVTTAVATPVAAPALLRLPAGDTLVAVVTPAAMRRYPRPTSTGSYVDRGPRLDEQPFRRLVAADSQDPLDMQEVLDILGSQDPQDEDVAAFQEREDQVTGDPDQVTRCPFCYRRLPEGLVHVHEAPASLLDKVTLDFDLYGATRYIFRGMPRVTSGGVIQSRLEAGGKTSENGSILLGYFSNLNLSNSVGNGVFTDGNAGDLTEIDIFAEYAHQFGSVAAVLGFISYNFPNHNARYHSNREVYIGVEGVEKTLGFRAYSDVADINGVYLTGWAQHSFSLSERLSLLARVQLGWADADMAHFTYGTYGDTMTNLSGDVELSYLLGNYTRFFLGIHGSSLLDAADDSRMAGAGFDSDFLWATLGVNWSF